MRPNGKRPTEQDIPQQPREASPTTYREDVALMKAVGSMLFGLLLRPAL
jgi:hypothetical protein